MRVIGFHIDNYDDHLYKVASENRLIPESEIKEYCKINKHNIISWFKIKSANSDSDIHDNFRKLVIKENKVINLISQKTEENFVKRHIIDCAQASDFIDKNSKICTDVGS